MKVFLDIGATLIVVILIYTIAAWFVAVPNVGATFQQFPGGLVAVPIAFFVFFEWGHMIKQRHWYWLLSSLVLAPLNIIAYYFAVHRKQLVAT